MLASLRAPDGREIFSVDNRGADLFVMLTYPHEIKPEFVPTRNGAPLWDIYGDVAFVALKNGEHNGIGYLIDTGIPASKAPRTVALTELPLLVARAVGA